ncbi:hypothetical protein A2U01_0059601, partial [Trifolium medium]|nr:hypothetical protein [Trifolium medium]
SPYFPNCSSMNPRELKSASQKEGGRDFAFLAFLAAKRPGGLQGYQLPPQHPLEPRRHSPQ